MNWFYQLFLINTVALANDSNKLISVIVLFRHGARAPTDKLSNQTYQQYFPNGLGELTSKGIEHSYLLGKFLRDRYVATGFLRTPLLPSQVYFRSKANNRCLMSASLVANGMFDVDGRPSGAVVPIYSQEKGDRLLSGTLGCDVELKRINDTCGRQPAPSYTNFTEYEGFIYECLGLQKNSTLFPTGKSFEVADSFINEYQNGLPMPPWFDEHRKEIYGSFVKVENFIIGAGEYHNPDVLRVKSGFLLYTVLNQLKSNWERFASQGALEKNKFIAYSTQDWLMQAFMDSLGIRSEAIGDASLPVYNSLIILELRRVKDVPVIKVFYRDPSNETLNDVTPSIRGCESQIECSLPQVLSCCPQYTTENPERECHPSRISIHV